ncbi:MAG: hypothetical protein JNK78_06750 [Planctomycetes bacterium]|nr:hypothetical protein [Planctomycetota bacterium]
MSRAAAALALLACVATTSERIRAQDAFAACETWLAAEQPTRAQLEAALERVLAEPATGFEWLGRERTAAAPDGPARCKAIESLATHAVVEFVRRQHRAGVRYAGQYAALAKLEPFAGELLFSLLLETPAWFPHTHRARLVPALRDLFPRAPSEARLAQIAALAKSSIEPEELVRALDGLSWQWGDKQAAQARIDELKRASAEGDVEERVRVMLDLAELWYDLREYRSAAATHRAVLALANGSAVLLKPAHHYASACAHALSGDVEQGIAALQRCAAAQTDPRTDASHRVARTLWEKDPEIVVLRGDPRYAKIFAEAFGANPSPEPAEKAQR